MKSITYILAILSAVASGGATLLALVLLVACAPNSTPAQSRMLECLAAALVAACGLGLVGCVTSLMARRGPLAVALGLSPIAVVAVVVGLLFAL
jgi:hypothetical protein